LITDAVCAWKRCADQSVRSGSNVGCTRNGARTRVPAISVSKPRALRTLSIRRLRGASFCSFVGKRHQRFQAAPTALICVDHSSSPFR
jgi:hypothetical protein